MVGTKLATRPATKLLVSAVQRGRFAGGAEVACGALGALDDGAVVVVVPQVEHGPRGKRRAASPAVNESKVNADLPPLSVSVVLGVVSALLSRASIGFVLAVMLGAVASVCYLDAVGLGAVALHCHIITSINRQHVQVLCPAPLHGLVCR